MNRCGFVFTLPTLNESGLGRSEYDKVITAVCDEVADSVPAKKRRGGSSGSTYTTYAAEQRARIGKYALQNGNERARRHFLSQLPNLKESTIRSFKKAYKQELENQRKKSNPQPVMVIPAKCKGVLPYFKILMES